MRLSGLVILCFCFFNDTATTEIYTLSLHDALPISSPRWLARWSSAKTAGWGLRKNSGWRSEEHTSELQSRGHLVCRHLPEKKKKIKVRLPTNAKTLLMMFPFSPSMAL